MFQFEFDPIKSKANQLKHGINFIEAQAMWLHPVYEVWLQTADEPRWLVIGIIGSKHWSAIITIRNAKIRIISCRRSRDEEKKKYNSSQK